MSDLILSAMFPLFGLVLCGKESMGSLGQPSILDKVSPAGGVSVCKESSNTGSEVGRPVRDGDLIRDDERRWGQR